MEGQKWSNNKLPVYTVIYKQFPKAIQEVVRCSYAGHMKYPNDADWMNFKRVEDAVAQYKNAALRHLFEKGINEDMKEYSNVLHEAQVIWNLLAALEIQLSNENDDLKF